MTGRGIPALLALAAAARSFQMPALFVSPRIVGDFVGPAQLDAWARRRWRASNTHPRKRGRR